MTLGRFSGIGLSAVEYGPVWWRAANEWFFVVPTGFIARRLSSGVASRKKGKGLFVSGDFATRVVMYDGFPSSTAATQVARRLGY